MPVWGALLRELAVLARDDGYPVTNDLIQTIDKGRMLEAGQDLQQIISASSLEGYLAGIFADSAVLPSPAHLILPEMRFRAVLTTNYDTLIEDAYLEVTGALPITLTYEGYVSRQRNPIRNNDFFVYKIHGDYRDASTIALGTRSYQDRIHWNPGYRFLLESILNAYTVLFVGFGGSDPDVNHVLDALAARFRGQSAAHYILLPQGRWTNTERRRAREDCGLDLIEYDAGDNHIQVGAFLGELARGRPASDGRLHVVVVIHQADEESVPALWTALGAGPYEVTTVDLRGAAQAGWFDKLRAQVELCDVVIPVISGNYPREDALVELVSNIAERKSISVLAGPTLAPSLLATGDLVLTTADELWLVRLLEKLEEIRLALDMGG